MSSPLRRLPHSTARRIRDAHLVAAVFWGPVMIPVTLVSGLKHSLPFLVAVSLYANMGAHLSAWAGESATVAAEAAHEHLDR